MEPMEVLRYPDEVLRKPCRELSKDELGCGELNGRRISDLVAHMILTMLAKDGVGLAAPQIGIPVRLFVARLTSGENSLALLNPVIKDRSGLQSGFEGCLSLPGVSASVERADQVIIEGINPMGEYQMHTFDGIEARIVQHEVDHLDGVVFLQRTSDEEYRKLMKNIRSIMHPPIPPPTRKPSWANPKKRRSTTHRMGSSF